MVSMRSEARNGLRYCVFSLAAIAAILFVSSDAADARHHRHARVHYVHREVRVHRQVHAEGYSPPSASIVVDGNTGAVLQESNPDALRHPASLTKIMTLYLLFEELDAGKIRLDSPLRVSEHASEQSPTKLGLKPGQTIMVDDAIKGVVTRSANDAAVVIAENLGGSEDDFAKLMTQKAHALGMSRTTYVNASGLPDDDQITTARDQALLGRAIQERFPRYYKYFSLPAFVYHGEAIRNHDHLLGSVQGVDGIKTGFTRASGFNLVTSLHRDGRYLVAVVMGGHSAFERDAHMRELLGTHIKEASARRTAPEIAERTDQRDAPAAFAKAWTASRAELAPTPAPGSKPAVAGTTAPIQPVLVKTISYRIATAQTAALTPMPAMVPVAAPAPPAATRTQAVQAAAPQVDAPQTVVASAEPITTATVAAPKPEVAAVEAPKPEPVKPEPPRARSGWVIQIGAYDGEDEAKQHLSAAQIKVRAMLAAADPFTERVQKGDKALYRARFAGFDKETAAAACRQLKRNDFDCMTVKN